jgi:2-polyprenyl-3-methyl-5-hydroxy-6-metoxy-1,4-benzoquinol methylase
MQARMKFTEYSLNLFEKMPVLAQLHKQRLRIVGKQIQKQQAKSILEIGCYDLYAYYFFLQKNYVQKEQAYTALDAYENGLQNKNNIFIAKKNIASLQKKNANCQLVSSLCEEMDTTKKYDLIVTMETVEHVIDEKIAIKNIVTATKKNGTIIVSIPVEKYFFACFKELARKVFRRRKENANLKELRHILFGQLHKVNKTVRGHKGFDHEHTINLFEKEGVVLEKKQFYPFPTVFLANGVVLTFKKEK